MIYSDWILKLRLEIGDLEKLGRDNFDGDSTTTIFPLSHRKIKDASYVVTVGGAVKTEVTDYTLDKDTGYLTFTSAPTSGSDNVVVTYRYFVFRDSDYVNIINDAIDYFQWKIFKELIDSTTLTTVKNQYEYNLNSISSNVIALVNAWYKTSVGALDWVAAGVTNYRLDSQLNSLLVNPPFDTSSLPMKFHFILSFIKGSATSSTVDIPDKYLLPYKYYVFARYFERLGFERVGEIGAITTHPFFMNAPNTVNLAEMYYKKADDVANKIAPKLPPILIRQSQQGVAM